jgi:transcriptional regulator with XRE-family HTH domain
VILLNTRLRELREDHDLTQVQCAKIAHISKNSYIRYENDERMIPLDTAIVFAKYYHVSLDYLAKLSNTSKTTTILNKIL